VAAAHWGGGQSAAAAAHCSGAGPADIGGGGACMVVDGELGKGRDAEGLQSRWLEVGDLVFLAAAHIVLYICTTMPTSAAAAHYSCAGPAESGGG